jgi:uncharacterized protein (DUF488 family)
VRVTTNTFFTIGHSTRTLVKFVDLLRESNVDLVVDVRSIPRSRTNPQFNLETLPEGLAPWRIGYKHMAELGGLRGKQRLAESSPNAYWRGRSFRNYADYALTEPFASGLAQLREQPLRHVRRSLRLVWMTIDAEQAFEKDHSISEHGDCYRRSHRRQWVG